MITYVFPDKERAKSLRATAETTLQRLSETDRLKYQSNTLTDYYDIIHELMEALAFIQGVKVRGEGAHQELIDYTAKNHGFDEQTREFIQQMRIYRNRISYEGFSINKNYIKLNEGRINAIIGELKKKVDELLN